MTDSVIGAGFARATDQSEFELGTVVESDTGEFVYVRYLLQSDKGEIVILSTGNGAVPMDLTGAAAAFGARIGVCPADAGVNDYGWVQVRGDVAFQADAGATANTQMYATAVAGQIGVTEADDGALANIVLTEVAGSIAGLVNGRILNPTAGAATGSGGGGGGGSPVSSSTVKVPHLQIDAREQTANHTEQVGSTWDVIKFSTSGADIELGPVQIRDLSDLVTLWGMGVCNMGAGNADAFGVEMRYAAAKSETKDGTYSAYATIASSAWSPMESSQGTIFRSKLVSGDTAGDRNRDYSPSSFTAGTWTDMGRVAADVGDWVKFKSEFKTTGSNSPNIAHRYGWKFKLLVEGTQDAVSSVSGGGGVGSGLSEIPILAPDSAPTKEDWEARGAQWTGAVMAPIEREFIGTHGAVARFATISATDGREIISTTGSYNTMRASFITNATMAWTWVLGQAVKIGDLCYRQEGLPDVYWYCVRDHTTAAGDIADGPPNVEAQTGWVPHTRAEVANRTMFRGVYYDGTEAFNDIGQASLAAGDWIVTTAAGYVYPEIRDSQDSGWDYYSIPGIGTLHGPIYPDNAEAATDVRSFNSSALDYFVIDGHLKILNFYNAPATGTAVYHSRAVYKNNPVAEYWGIGQTERWPATWPNTDNGDQIRRLRFATAGPHRAFDGAQGLGDIFVPVASVSSSIDAGLPATAVNMVFSLPTGRYHFRLHAGVNVAANNSTLSIRKITTGADDIEVASLSWTGGVGTLVPNTELVGVVYPPLIANNMEVVSTNQFYCSVTQISGNKNTKHYLEIERVG